MTTFKSHRAEPYFTYVKNGQKTIEGRLYKDKYMLMKTGDIIEVFNNEETDSVRVRIKRVETYPSLQKMLEREDLKRILPDADSIDGGVAIYRRFYTPEQEEKFGVVAIEIERTSS